MLINYGFYDKNPKKLLAFRRNACYNKRNKFQHKNIAMKREVALQLQWFSRGASSILN